MLIDSHQHFWDRRRSDFDHSWQDDLPTLKRSFLPEDLGPILNKAGVRKSVFVQTQHNVEENRWALELAEQHDFVAGVVGWVDLASLDCEAELLQFLHHPKFVGIRHLTQDEPDDDFLLRPDVMQGLHVLEKHEIPFDLLLGVRHLRHVPRLAREFPNLRMVIDHLAKPEIKHCRLQPWTNELKAASQCENIYCKLSGLITEAHWQQWTVGDLKPYVQVALDSFGPDRCMFGSDWPVCLLAGSYEQVIGALNEAIGPLSATERRKVFGETAANYYRL